MMLLVKIFDLATFDSYTKSVSYIMSQIEKKCFIIHAHSVNHLNKGETFRIESMLKHNTLEHLTHWPKNAAKGIY